jgi:hypothetical protein
MKIRTVNFFITNLYVTVFWGIKNVTYEIIGIG